MKLEKVSDYVTCGELIDRLGCLTIEFVKGIRRGIVPKPTSEAGGFRTAETDPAFYDPSLMPSVDEWAKYVRAAKIFRFFAESSWPRMIHELGHCWEVVETATTPPTATTELGHAQQAVTPEDVVAQCRAEGIKDPKDIARRVDGIFTGDRRLSPRALGRLLPADPSRTSISTGGQRDRGKRLRGEKP